MKAFIVLELALVAAAILTVGCGRQTGNPYAGAQAFPLSSAYICTNAVLKDGSVTQFSGVVDCSSGSPMFSADRYTALSPILPGTYASAQTGLRCSFTVDAACNLSAITIP